jgi:hypothetical protein
MSRLILWAKRRVSPPFMNIERRRFLRAATIGSSLGAAGRWGATVLRAAPSRPGGTQRHEVYQPKVQRGYVVESALDGLPYNHCSTVMWFKDRWFCAWNGNDKPIEGTPGLQAFMSTSVDGRNWSAPFAPFSDPARCETPYRLLQGRQWQPVSAVIGGELWCFFWQNSSRPEDRGLMFGRLREPDGKWTIRRLELGEGGRVEMLGRWWAFFTAQNPVQLRSGRVLVPLTLVGEHNAPDAVDHAPLFRRRSKRATVIYSEDGGGTWEISPGCAPKDRTWRPWEPTVWEQSDGSVAMIFKNNSHPSYVKEMPRPSEFLFRSLSRDGGATWAQPAYLPIESVSSRMYVFPLDGAGSWRPGVSAVDRPGRLWLMVQNDFPGGTGWQPDRRDLALFFKRGDGFAFTPGPVFSGSDPVACYPQASVHGDAMVVTYTESYIEKRSIRYAHLSPLPNPAKRYLLPRADVERTPRPRHEGAVLYFEGAQHVDSQSIPNPGRKGLALAAWIRPDSNGILLDTRRRRTASSAAGGFSWGVTVMGAERTPVMYLQTGGASQLAAMLPIRRGEWMYAGIDLDPERGRIHFLVDDRTMEVPLPRDAARALAGANARIGAGQSTGTPFFGAVRFLGCFDGPIGNSAHAALYDRFAGESRRLALDRGTELTAKRLLWMDPAALDFPENFILPKAGFQGVRTAQEDARQVLRFTGEGSAGVDLDENNRACGDAVGLRFRFQPRQGERLILCTVGDANKPARVRWDRGFIKIAAGEMIADVGRAPLGAWSELEIRTAGDFTEASVNGGAFGRVTHEPEGTWVFLGQGYRTGGGSVDDTFLVDVGSVESNVQVSGTG